MRIQCGLGPASTTRPNTRPRSLHRRCYRGGVVSSRCCSEASAEDKRPSSRWSGAFKLIQCRLVRFDSVCVEHGIVHSEPSTGRKVGESTVEIKSRNADVSIPIWCNAETHTTLDVIAAVTRAQVRIPCLCRRKLLGASGSFSERLGASRSV